MTDAAANTALIDRFYEAFARRDHATMASLYHPEAHFRDPAFGDLNGSEITAMWRMLCEGGADLRLTHADVSATEDAGAARWEARYTFAQTGRPVINRISARFRFRDGLI
ncbi:MAG: nuclear transport factor 2 family protein, partial [Candidatus Dormibacteria bacterium]